VDKIMGGNLSSLCNMQLHDTELRKRDTYTNFYRREIIIYMHERKNK